MPRMIKRLALATGLILSISSACGRSAAEGPGQSTPSPTITPTPTPSPAQILAAAGDAMLAMRSARFTLVHEGGPVTIDSTTGMGFTEAAGEYQAPDRVSAKAKVTFLGNVLELEIFWLPEGTYLMNPLTHQLETVPADFGIDGAALFSADGIPAALSTGIQNPQRVGYETVEGVRTIHISGEADGAVLSPLMAGALESGTLYPVDAWIDESTYDLVRFHITEPDGNGWLIDIFDIDEPIEIQKP
jgi:lipoprotein LprG